MSCRDAPDRLRILLIEDDENVQDYVRAILGHERYELVTASSGKIGMDLVRGYRPRLILLDLVLPGLNGIEVLKALRHDPQTRGIPVLVISGMDNSASVLKSALTELGVDDYVQKPFIDTLLVERIKRLLAASPEKPSARVASPPLNGCERRLERGRIRLDLESRRVWVSDRLLRPLGPKRFDLLCALLRHPEGATKESLRLEVWGEDSDYKTVDMTVHRLRGDLGISRGGPIVSLPNGYRLIG